jgi:hypothetical protein
VPTNTYTKQRTPLKQNKNTMSPFKMIPLNKYNYKVRACPKL